MLDRLELFRKSLLPPEANQAGPTHIQMALWGLVVVLMIALSLWHYESFQVGATQDDAEYVILARSLVYADRYGMMNTPGQPSATRFPFGFPMALAVVETVFPGDMNMMKLLSLAATILNASLLFWGWQWYSRTLSHWWALAATALYALSPLTVGQTRGILSEPLFTTWLLIALLLTEVVARRRMVAIGSLSLGVVCALMTFTRTIGIVAVVAIMMHLVITRKREAINVGGLAVVGSILTIVLVVALTKVELRDLFPAEYLNQFSTPATWGQTQINTQLVDRFFSSVREYGTQHIRSLILPIGGGESEQVLVDRFGVPFLPVLAGWAVSVLVCLGAVRLLIRERSNSFLLASVFYAGAIVLWPWRGPRFLYPVQPQFFVFFLFALEAAGLIGMRLPLIQGRTWLKKFPDGLVIAITLMLISISVAKNARLDDSRWHTGDLQLRTVWINQQAAPGSVVLSDNPAVDFIYGGRSTIRWIVDASPGDFNEFLNANQVNYVLIAPDITWQQRYNLSYSDNTLQALAQLTELEDQGRAQLAYESESGDVKVFQITR